MTHWKPPTYNSVSVYLMSEKPEAVLAFLRAVFDGEILRHFSHPDGSIMHAEIRIDDTVVMLSGGGGGEWAYQAHLHVYVKDVEATYQRALEYGAEPVQPPQRKTPDDDCRGGVRDACGNTWWIATQ